jgi:hypothetical protein
MYIKIKLSRRWYGYQPQAGGKKLKIHMDFLCCCSCCYQRLHAPAWPPPRAAIAPARMATVGCSDFHIFSQSCQVSPIPAFLRTLVFRKYKKKIVTFAISARTFFNFSKIYIFSKLFKTNFLSQF